MPFFDDNTPQAMENGLQLGQKKTSTGAAGAVTSNANSGVITTEALATAAAGVQAYTLTNSKIKASNFVLFSPGLGTATTGLPLIGSVVTAAGSCTFVIKNGDAAAAFNGTLKVGFLII